MVSRYNMADLRVKMLDNSALLIIVSLLTDGSSLTTPYASPLEGKTLENNRSLWCFTFLCP